MFCALFYLLNAHFSLDMNFYKNNKNVIRSIKDDIKFRVKNRQKGQKRQKDEKQIFPKSR